MSFFSKSIMWKLVMPIIGFFLFVLVGFSIFLPLTLSNNTENETVASAINTSEQFKKLRTYYSTYIVGSVVNDENQVTSSTDHRGKSGVIPIPATFLHDVTEEMSSENIKFSLYSPYPFANRQERKLDDFNRNAWEYLKDNPKSAYSEFFDQDGREFIRVGVADLLTDQSCVSCHNHHPDSLKTDWNLGDVRGILEMNIDITDEKIADRNLSLLVTSTLFILLVLIVLVIVFSFSRLIQKRVRAITRAVDSVVEGDLTTELNYASSQDELATIMKSVNRITNQYKETIKLISDSADQLKERATSLNHVTVATKKGTQRQSQLSIQTDGSMIEMLDTVTQVTGSATKATDAAKMAQDASEKGRQIVDYSVVAVESMAEKTEASTVIISQLQGNVEKIGTVSSVIGAIAEQTNLLALNAAIEAARAGEQGRGFAVVADEVRSLASKTMNSTGEIDLIISELQGTTASMVDAMAKNNEQANEVVNKIQDTERSLSSISNQVDEITLVNNDIQYATEMQTKVADNVNTNISQIADISRNVEEGTNRIAESAIELDQVAQQMQDLCQRFKLT